MLIVSVSHGQKNDILGMMFNELVIIRILPYN